MKYQPITRAEFEAGVKFCYNDNHSFYIYEIVGVNTPIISDRWDNYYALVERIEDDGFIFITCIFGFAVSGKVLFENCMKYEINKSQD